MLKKHTAIPLTIAGSLLAVALILFATDVVRQNGSLRAIRQKGVIRIGYAVEAPYAFLTPDGEVTGEAPEVAKQMAARLGIPRIQWRQTEFASLMDELEAGRIDLIAAGMFVTPERMERVAFSVPTFQVRQGLLVKAGNPLQLHAYRQAVEKESARIAVLSGAVEERLLRKLGMTEPRLLVVPDALTGRVAVESGNADGLALSLPTVRWMALTQQLGRTEMATPFEHAPEEQLGYGAFAFRKKDRRLLAAWNESLQSYLGSPEHQALAAQFGFTPAELPVPSARPEVPAK